MSRDARFHRSWYDGEPPRWWQRVLAVVFRIVSGLRHALYKARILPVTETGVPVIVIGNLTAGGAGKTPLAIALVRELVARGFRPGIVSRGYGGRVGKVPASVSASTPVSVAGDEPVMLAVRSGVPVFVHPRRVRAASAMRAAHEVDVIVCDDGLQHYALARDVEIAVVDGRRGFGNGRLLPAGPLRESPRRLRTVDQVVVNGDMSAEVEPVLTMHADGKVTSMHLVPVALVNLGSGERLPPDALAGQRCVAVAGIGNPQRFFSTLAELGYTAECRAFPDHHAFVPEDLAFAGERPLLMTEKDAVKCRSFASPGWWYLEIAASLEPAFVDAVAAALRYPGETGR